MGPSAQPPDGLTAEHTAVVERLLTESLGTAVRIALLFAVVLVFCGALLSLLIPRVRPRHARTNADDQPSWENVTVSGSAP